MLYEIRMMTSAAYERPANSGRHLVRLVPADSPMDGQRLVAGSLDINPPPRERSDGYDFFGNRFTAVTFDGSHDAIEFAVRARVDRIGTPAVDDTSPPLDGLSRDLAAVRSVDARSPHHFTAASPLVRPSEPIAAYARAFADPAQSAFAAARALSRALHADLAYDGEATTVDTPLEEAFAARRGVCQDFAHIMIACLREVGIPAGYVSGFLRTEPPKGEPRLEGADAMHAWVQAWCGATMGWVEFDPTNDLVVAQDHIVVARGRDYSDVAPVKGVLWTAGSQKTEQSVDVTPLSA